MAVSTIPQAELNDSTTLEQAASYLSHGMVTMPAYLAWMHERESKRATARITISAKGRVVLNGVTKKGDGFAPNYTPKELSTVLEHAPLLIQAVLANADKCHPDDATHQIQNPDWDKNSPKDVKRFIAAPHPRAGLSMLAYESESEMAHYVQRLQAVLAKLTA